MRSRLRSVLALALIAAGPAAAQNSPFQTKVCPLPAEAVGYPVSVEAAGGVLDSAYAGALAYAIARRWEPPSPGRGEHRGLRGLRSRVQTPEPRWPQDWAPSAGDTARVAITLFHNAKPGPVQLVSGSENVAFDQSVVEHFRHPAPASPPLPPLPAGVSSLRVLVGFGVAPAAGARTVHFAAQQEPARLTPGSFRLIPEPAPVGAVLRDREAVVKYDIDAAGRITPGSMQILGTNNGIFAAQVVDALGTARGTPAISNCRPVASSVVQRFQAR